MRVTTERIPISNNLSKEIALPLGIIVKPFGDPLTVLNLLITFYREKK
jgi:hypothetical protein